MDWKKEYEKIGNKPVPELTNEDKYIIFKYYESKAVDNFQDAIGYAEECGIRHLEDLMTTAKCMVFDVEDKGIDIGSMN